MQAQMHRIVDRRSCSNSLRGFVGSFGQFFVERKNTQCDEKCYLPHELFKCYLSNDIIKKISFVRMYRINETLSSLL